MEFDAPRLRQIRHNVSMLAGIYPSVFGASARMCWYERLCLSI